MLRKSLAAAAALAIIAGLYAVAGYLVAPGYVRQALADAAAARGLTIELVAVRTNPIALRVHVDGLALQRQGRRVATIEQLSADLAWASLWRPSWIVETLRVGSPDVALDAVAAGAAGTSADASEPVALTIRELVVTNGRLRHDTFDLQALHIQARELATTGGAGTYEATAQLANGGGSVSSRGSVTLASFSGEGRLDASAVNLARFVPVASGRLDATARYAFSQGAFALEKVVVTGNDVDYSGVKAPEVTLRADRLPLPLRGPVPIDAQAKLAPHGTLAAQGNLSVEPLRAQLHIDAQSLPLPMAQRWMPREIAVRINSGTVSARGQLDVRKDNVRYAGSMAVSSLRLQERDTGALLLGWHSAETDALRAQLSPLSIQAAQVSTRAPEGRLVIEADGSVNLAKLFGAGKSKGTQPAQVAVERLRIENGTLYFADRSLETPFQATIASLSGSVSGFSTAKGEAARVRLDGRVQPYGVARIRGTVDLNAPTTRADITANLRNLRLEAFNPYVTKFAGYRIKTGRLSAKLRYEMRDGQVVGTNGLVFENMQLGEKLETKALVDLPLELAVALLTDENGRIDLDVPVRGNLNDPQFDIGTLVARALGNTVKRIVSAPFRALASLFGNGESGPGDIAFVPGAASLPPPAEEKLAQLAGALGERPQLRVVIRGGYDPARDAEALRIRAAREEVARAAGVKPPLNLGDRKVVRAAEALYLRRAGDRAQLQALKKSEGGYGWRLLQQLAAATPIDDAAPEALARSRAESVRAALLGEGIDPARVAIGDTVRTDAAEDGVPSELELSAPRAGRKEKRPPG